MIVNADLPCVLPYDLRSLEAATPLGGIAIVPSEDGRTNALSLPSPDLFQPLYGANSAKKFRSAAEELGVEAVDVSIPNLADDVDTRDDLERIASRAGPATQAALNELRAA
jgi:2-phospho-L-lactate guanylyltransferase